MSPIKRFRPPLTVRQNADINCGKVDAESFGIIRKERRLTRIEEQPATVRLDIQAQPVLKRQSAGGGVLG